MDGVVNVITKASHIMNSYHVQQTDETKRRQHDFSKYNTGFHIGSSLYTLVWLQ